MKRGERGNVMVEFAFSMALLIPLSLGMFQVGEAFYNYNKLETAVRAGARYASIRSYNSSSGTPSAAFLSAVRNVVVYGDPAGGTRPVVAGIAPQDVNLTVTMNGATPATMEVRVGRFTADTIFGTLKLQNKPLAVYSYGGRYTAGY